MSVARLLPLLPLLLLAGRAHAEAGREVPDAAAAWAVRLERGHEPIATAKPAFLPGAPAGLPCPDIRHGTPSGLQRPGMEAARARFEADPEAAARACQALTFESWMLRLDFTPVDQRVFARSWIRVIELPVGRDAAGDLDAWLDLGVLASKEAQALVPVGRYLLDLHLPCGASGLLDYEVADLVASLGQDPPLPLPERVAVSRCGQLHFEARTRAEVEERGRRETEFWGMPFPEARDRLRAARANHEAP